MGEALDQIGLHAGQVGEVLGLAVALVEPREDAEDLGGPLRAEDRIGLDEGRHVEAADRSARRSCA